MAIDEQAIQRLLDKDAIREATLRYTRGIDRHDDDLVVQAYHAGATDDHGPYGGDPAGLARFAHEQHSQHWDVHHHYITNQTIDVDGDTAHAETYYLASLRRKDGTIDMFGGRYIDRLERRNETWAIAERACLTEWGGQLLVSETQTNLETYLQGSWDRNDISYQRPLALSRLP